MKEVFVSVFALFLLAECRIWPATAARFEKVSDHFYCLQSKDGGPNVGALVTRAGVLLVNPPAEPQLSVTLEALKQRTASPVLWVLFTDYSLSRTGAGGRLSENGAIVLESKDLRRLVLSAPRDAQAAAAGGTAPVDGAQPRADPAPEFVFTRQMRLFPDDLEVRIFAVEHKSHTAGDVVAFAPAEKIIISGDLFRVGSFPLIDQAGGDGSALGWIEGLRQVIDAVPVLKSAMPQPKPDPAKPPEEKKTLEELVTVIPGEGPPGNLQQMKDLLEAAQKLRGEIAKAVAAGRSRENILASPALNAYRSYGNLESYAAKLFEELASQRGK